MLGSLILLLKGMRIMMFQLEDNDVPLSGHYRKNSRSVLNP